VAIGLGGLLVAPAIAKSEGHKITICHVPPGNPGNAHAIDIDRHAWENGHSPHNAHALDYVVGPDGQCSTSGTTTTTTILEL
jgi:hypothetical protein